MLTAATRPASRDRYLYEVEFVCSMCARWVCDVRVADPKGTIQLPSTRRCPVCGGVPLRSGDVRQVYVGRKITIDPPPRGRPPKAREAA